MERKGIITSRTCPRCGHHEIGFTTRDGVFHPLKPGTLIELIGPSEETGLPESQVAGQGFSWPSEPLQGLTSSGITEGPLEHGDAPRGFDEEGENFSHYDIWFPDPLVVLNYSV